MPRPLPQKRRYSFRNHPITTTPARPMSELNITPLIDVLLVLLVMLMLSIPIATHKVEIDLPKGGESTEEIVVNNLRLNAEGIAVWNGAAVADKDLRKNLIAMTKDPAKPQLHFETDGHARYERFDEIIAMIKRAKVNEIGFIGNQQFANWDQ